jgi:sarcosine oxidase, subunit gamma
VLEGPLREPVLTARLEAARAGASPDPGVRIAEPTPCGKLTLRGDDSVREAAGRTLGMKLPDRTGATAARDGITALMLGPDEWLLTGPAEIHDLESRLREALAGRHLALVEVSDNTTVLRLSGPRARDVLAKGCPLDLHPRVFAPGRVAQSLIGKVEVILHQTADDTYDLHTRRSFADHLLTFLLEAASEWGYAVEE